MYWNDHEPPHFHAIYGGDEALIEIQRREIYRGWLPSRAIAMVFEWSELHEQELIDNWARARTLSALLPIDPLE